MGKYENEIKETLRDIIDYIGADRQYVNYAQLITYVEWLLRRCGVRDA